MEKVVELIDSFYSSLIKEGNDEFSFETKGKKDSFNFCMQSITIMAAQIIMEYTDTYIEMNRLLGLKNDSKKLSSNLSHVLQKLYEENLDFFNIESYNEKMLNKWLILCAKLACLFIDFDTLMKMGEFENIIKE